MVNRVVLIGRLTRDPNELRVSPSGVSVTSFTVAVDNRFSKQETNKTDFIHIYPPRTNTAVARHLI